VRLIPYARQDISEADIAAVVEVLRSDWLTQGPTIERFEGDVAARCRAPHAIAVTSGTAALHLACLALDLGPGDRLWTSPNTFVASANCARYCGAEVDFVDIDPRTCNISVDALDEKLREAERLNALPKIVVPVHFGGLPCDMAAIAALAARYGFKVVEDASHALGGELLGEPVGSCRWSDAAVLSFHPVKLITTGEGGMVTTRAPELAQRIRTLRTHGITRDPGRVHDPSHGAWYYEQQELGFNYRMTDIQAALGLSQLGRLNEFLNRRRALVAAYDYALRDLPLRTPTEEPGARSAWHLYVVQLGKACQRERRAVFDDLRAAGIQVNVHYIPVHLQPYYARLGFRRGLFPNAERYYERAISLPLFFGLSDDDQAYVVASLRSAVG
jgi:UDP-4-amino-4,6-dideoxy-N-acetyl-beta-L-altrosamine transaminase